MSTKHKSINPDTIDFRATALCSNGIVNFSNITPLSNKDSIQWYFKNGYRACDLLVSTVLKWIEANNLHVPEDMEAHECDSLKWLDDNFESATEAYFMAVYAEEGETAI